MKIGLSLAAGALMSMIAVATAWSQTAAPDETHERERIAAAKRAVETRFSARQQACLARFASAACIEDAKRERRDALSVLENDRHRLDDRLRQARAAARLESIRKRTEEAQQRAEAVSREAPRQSQDGRTGPEPRHRERTPAQESGAKAKRRALDKANLHSSAPAASAAPTRSREDPTLRLEREAQKRAAFDAAQRAAEAHRAEVEKRNAERAAQRKPAAPLPLPPAASAP